MAKDDVSQQYLVDSKPMDSDQFAEMMGLTVPEIEVTPDDVPQKPDYLGTRKVHGEIGGAIADINNLMGANALPESRGVVEQNLIGVERGVIKAGTEAYNSLKSLGNYFPEQVLGGEAPFKMTPRVEERVFNDSTSIFSDTSMQRPESISAGITEGATQFLSTFVPILSGTKFLQAKTLAMKTLSTGTNVAKKLAKGAPTGAIAGAGADFTAFNPYDERLADYAKNSGIVGLDNALTDYIASDPNDTELEGRYKQVLEGLIIGGMAEVTGKALIKTITAYKQIRRQKGVEAGVFEPTQAENAAYITDLEGNFEIVSGKINPQTGRIIDPKTGKDLDYPMRSIPDNAEPVRSLDDEVAIDLSNKLLDGDLEGVARIQSKYVNLEYVNTPDDVKDLIEAINLQRDIQIPKTTRGWKEAAKKDGTTLKDYTAKVAGLDTDVLRASKARNTVAYVVQNLSRIAKANPTAENIFAFQNAFLKYNMIDAMVSQNASEIARALRAMGSDQGVAKGITKALQKAGLDSRGFFEMRMTSFNKATGRHGYDEWARVASFIADMPDSETMARMAKAANMPDWSDAMVEVYINSLFTLKTVTTNLLATGASIGGTAGERYIGAAKNVFNKDPDAIGFREANAYFANLLMAIPEGVHVLRKSYKTNIPQFSQSVKEGVGEGIGGSMAKETFGITASKYPMPSSLAGLDLSGAGNVLMRGLGLGIDVFGAVTRALGTKALMASDEGMKAVVYRAEVHALVARELRKEGLKPSSPAYREQEQLILKSIADKDPRSPWGHITMKATDEAHIRTFTEEMGKNAKNLQGIIRQVPFSHLLAPFFKTPVNLIKYVGRRTPILSEFSDHNRIELAAGGARAQLVEAQMSAGIMAYIAGGMLSVSHQINGDISGNWTVTANNDTLGIKQRAIVYEDGTQIQFEGFDGTPMSFVLLSATVREAIDEYIHENKDTMTPEELDMAVLEMSKVVVETYAKYAGNSTWARGVGEAMQVFIDGNSESGLKNITDSAVKGAANLVVPNSVRYITESLPIEAGGDDYARAVTGFVNNIKAKLPYYNKDVPKKPDMLGDAVPSREELLGVARVYVGKKPNDVVRAELRRIQEASPYELPMGGVVKSIGSGTSRIKLTKDETWNVMQFMAKVPVGGVLLEDALAKEIESEDYKQGTDTYKESILTDVFLYFKEEGVERMKQDQQAFLEGRDRSAVKNLELFPYTRKTSILRKQAMSEIGEQLSMEGNTIKSRKQLVDEIVVQSTDASWVDQLK